MAILTIFKNKKDTRNSVQAPSSKKSSDQLSHSPLSQLSSTSSMSSAAATQQSPQTTFNSNSSNLHSRAPSSGATPAAGAPATISEKSISGPPLQQQMQKKASNPSMNHSQPQQGPHSPQPFQPQGPPNQKPHQGMPGNARTPSDSNTNYPTGISSPPTGQAPTGQAGPKMGNIPPSQHQLQQLQAQPRSGGPNMTNNISSLNDPNGSSRLNQGLQSPAMFQQRRPPFTQVNTNMPQYPWSQKSISNASPFPRYGHAANYIAARDGEVFVMGGLKGSNVFGDLWVIETDTLTGYLLDTDGCPSPRVGHASLTLGNAFIVFGGDTKIEDTDDLDDNLYLLNTTSLKWTIAGPVGRRPSGRYGHTVSTIGSVLYVFGGQLDDFFFDDLMCYDLTTLQSPTSHWNFVKPNSRSPPPRTNHTIITYQDKLYLFGGTDGKLWYSDTWVYDPIENTWSDLDCAGFIPAPCEGHSATIVGDIMYVFGGRSAEGKDLGSLSALKIPARKWFSFQNMGPGPTPRSGHSMTAFAGDKILIMGGESPDIDPDHPDASTHDYESTNIVYILDTARISYPPTISQPPPEKRSENVRQIASPPAVSGGNVSSISGGAPESNIPTDAIAETAKLNNQQPIQKVDKSLPPKAVRSESVVSELTPGYGYERVNVGDLDDKDDSQSSASEFEAHTPKNESRDYRDTQSDKTNTPASTIHPETSSSGNSPSAMQKNPSSEYDSSDTIQEESSSGLHPTESVENVDQALEQLKASNSWYETELAAAREKGFIPSTRPPVDVMRLRRVSQRVTMDTEGSLTERAILIEALSDLKDELQEVRQNVKRQAEQASAKIAEAEADRDDAFERMKLLEAQLLSAQGIHSNSEGSRELNLDSTKNSADQSATIASLETQLQEQKSMRALFAANTDDQQNLVVELDKMRSDNINLEQQLRAFSDKSILASHEASQYKTSLDDLQARCRILEDTTDEHVKSLAAASLAITAAKATSDQYLKLLSNRDADRAVLQEKLNTLTTELEGTRQELEEAHALLDEHKSILSKATEQDSTSLMTLTSGIDNIVAMWGASKIFNKTKTKTTSRDINSEDADGPKEEEEAEEVGEDDSEVSQLKKQLEDVTGLYQVHQKASTDAARELSSTLQQVSFLKQELVSVEQSRSETNTQLQKAQEDLEKVREDLEFHQAHLTDNKKSLDLATEEAKQKMNQNEEVIEDLKKQIAEYQSTFTSLESEYENSMQYVRNSDKALTVTRDELSKYKDTNSKLQTEIDQLRLRLQDQEDNEDTGSINSSNAGGARNRSDHRVGTPPAKYNSRQIDLQLRDLRAQIIILQEERDELRNNTLDIKKKLITHVEDLKDAQAMIEQLEAENDDLMTRVRTAEGGVTRLSTNGSGSSRNAHSYVESLVDPEHADRTLDDFTSELDQIRNQRERISGILNS